MKSNNLTLEVLVRGRPIKEFYHHDGNVYIEGRKTSTFELQIRNHNSYRVLAVPSVDGLSVMDGEIANSNSNGYIIEGFGNLTIPGWRLDNEQVAEFFFQGKKGEGYAAQTGKGGNEGVIGVMFFGEKVNFVYFNHNFTINIDPYPSDKKEPWGNPWKTDPWKTRPIGPMWTSSNATYTSSRSVDSGSIQSNVNVMNVNVEATPTMDSVPVEEVDDQVSIGFGESVDHSVKEVSFQRGSHLDTLAIYYDTRKGLEQRGIEVVSPTTKPKPSAFPGDKGCTPPPNWKA